jgi:hypothetical protein
MSSSPKVKFEPRNPRQPSAFTEAETDAFAFAEEVRGLGVGIVDAAIAEVVFKGERDPKVYGFALLCRSISNFEGVLTMARLDQAVESRTLVRSCFENLFLVDKLLKHGVEYVKTMRSHEAASRISIGQSALKHPGVAESPGGKTIRGHIKRERTEFPKPEKLTVSDTAKGEIEKMYPAYAMLSHDAAHASVTALKRHYRQDEKGLRTVEVAPPFKRRERLETLDMACNAVLGACIGVSELLGGTSQNEAVTALSERFMHQRRRAAPLAAQKVGGDPWRLTLIARWATCAR